MRRVLMCLALTAICATPATGATLFLNFDTDLNGNPIAGGTLVNLAYANPDVTFGANDTVRVGSGGAHSNPNFATGEPVGFAAPFDITILSPNLGNSVSVWNVSNSIFTLSVYDALNNLLGSTSCAFGDTTCNAVLSFPNQIARAQITTPSQFGIDDLTINYNQTATPVPEPLSLLLVGSGLAGMAGKRYLARQRR